MVRLRDFLKAMEHKKFFILKAFRLQTPSLYL